MAFGDNVVVSCLGNAAEKCDHLNVVQGGHCLRSGSKDQVDAMFEWTESQKCSDQFTCVHGAYSKVLISNSSKSGSMC